MTAFDRRAVLRAAAAIGLEAGLGASGLRAALAQGGLKLGPARPFSYDWLKATARRMAAGPYVGPQRPAPDIVGKINYEAWGQISFAMDHALYADGPGRFPVSFFHLGMFFQKAVEMNVVEGSRAREIIYDQSYFTMPADSIARKLPQGAGFAGLRVQEPRDGALDWRKNDWVAFLGAAYFRAIGALHQYGLSARAVAIDVAVAGKPEEFPDFTKFYIDGADAGDLLIIYALLEGPSIVGACRFVMTRGKGVVMDIDQDAVPARGRRALRPRAADHHVLVLGDEKGDRRRLAPRGARLRRPRHVDGDGRADLAPAQQSAPHRHLGVRR